MAETKSISKTKGIFHVGLFEVNIFRNHQGCGYELKFGNRTASVCCNCESVEEARRMAVSAVIMRVGEIMDDLYRFHTVIPTGEAPPKERLE